MPFGLLPSIFFLREAKQTTIVLQVQKLKVDSESAMLEMDQILKSNELSIALVAAVPAFLIAGGMLYWAARLVTPPPPDARTEAVPARLALVQSERCLARLATPEDGQDGELALGLFIYNLALVSVQRKRGGRSAASSSQHLCRAPPFLAIAETPPPPRPTPAGL